MRAPIVVATAALLLLPTLVEAQRARAAAGSGRGASAGSASTGSASTGSASAAAPRARGSSEGRSRAPTASPGGRGDPATAGAPGSWGSGPALARPGDGRPPHRSSPYGSTPYRSSPHRPVTPYYYVPVAPYGYYPYGYYPYRYFGFDYGRVAVGGSTVVLVTPQVTTTSEPASAEGYATAPAPPAAPAGKLLVVGGEGEAPLLDVEPVSDALLRLRWSGRAADVREVALLLLDADRALLAAQTVREAPFTAVFDRSPRAAFAGVAVTYGSGATMTTVVPLATDSLPAAAPAPPPA